MGERRFTTLDILELCVVIELVSLFATIIFGNRQAISIEGLIVLLNIFIVQWMAKELRKNIIAEHKYTKYFIEDCILNIRVFYAILIAYFGILIMIHSNYIEHMTKVRILVCISYVFGLIVVGMRYIDIRTSYKSNWTTADKEVKVRTIKDNCLNGKYCKIYMDKETDMAFEIDKKYKITYLSGTLGLYVISAEIKD